ncbi:MAG: ATP-binding protein [Eubacterium sp.]
MKELMSSQKLVKDKKISILIEELKTFSIPIGVTIVKKYPLFEIIFVNEMLFQMLGFNNEEEFLERYQFSAWNYVYSEDLEYLKREAAKRGENFEPYEITYRMIKKDGTYIWVNQRSQHMFDDSNDEFIFAYYTDITVQKQAEQLIETALHGYDVSIWEWDILHNKCYQTIHSSRCGRPKIDAYNDFPEVLFKNNHYHTDSIKTARSVFDRIRNGEKNVEAILHIYDSVTNEYWWESVCYTTVFDNNGKPIKAVAVGKDVTDQKKMEEEIKAGVQKYETLVNSIPGGVGMYEYNDAFTPIFISDQVYKLCAMTKEEYNAVTAKSTLDIFHPDDRQGLIDAVKKAYDEKRQFDYIHRVLQKNGNYHWIRVSGEVLTKSTDTPILYTVFIDVHEQIVAERALRESEFRYSTAVKSSNINVWEYDLKKDTITMYSNSPRINTKHHIIKNYTQLMMNKGYIRADSLDAFIGIFEKLRNGEKEVTADIWFKLDHVLSYWCERVTCTTIFDDEGKPIRAFGVGRDVTKEKEAEKRYHDELYYRKAMQNATMASINVNLTKNIILEGKSEIPEVVKQINKAKTAQEYFDSVYNEIIGEDIKKKCMALFNREEMIKRFLNGETTLSMEISRNIGGHRYWLIVTGHMMKRQEDNDIVAFLYSTDITNEKTMHNIMDVVVKTDYDYLVVVDAVHNSAIRYSDQDCGHAYVKKSHRFEEETHGYIRRYICKEDVAHVIEELTLKNILAQLDAHDTYSIFYSLFDANGALLKKQIRFKYIDREFKSFLMTRIDITGAVKEQEKKNQELARALKMAEYANSAKSEFLSRISHEIRTPMNAIIGLAQIASHRLEDQNFVLDCIKKSQYASDYLLSLIDDVLDMSKIETGKIFLKNKVIDGKRFFESINTIISSQAEIQGVNYCFNMARESQDKYKGDYIRLQQILINILSNAIKFTPKGGTVTFDVSKISDDGKKAKLCFKITDTGIGISEEFLPDIFKSFSQEHGNVATNYSGSGLGLAIAKNLAQLMDGDIEVESKKNIGTTFTVNLQLQIAPKDALPEKVIGNNVESDESVNFKGKKILLVEDHQLNIMVAKKLLEYKKVDVDVAENGKIGIERFETAPEYYYDAILMDIRMPVMDGLEATKSIRKLDKEGAKTIPIIAMSANAFDEDVEKSIKAGMNAHLAKPIDPDVLYHTLYCFISKGNKKENG